MDPLIIYIQREKQLLVVSDGSRSNKTSGGAWIIATEGGDEIISGYTPDFGDISQINSHRTYIFETLAVLLFLRQYSRFFKIAIQSQIIYYFDNKEVINKPQNLSDDRSYYSEYYKANDSYAILKNTTLFPMKFQNEQRQRTPR